MIAPGRRCRRLPLRPPRHAVRGIPSWGTPTRAGARRPRRAGRRARGSGLRRSRRARPRCWRSPVSSCLRFWILFLRPRRAVKFIGRVYMLQGARFAARLPAQDLERARRFYSEKLGLEPAEERPGGLLYHCAEGTFALFASTGGSPGTFTQAGFEVDDVEATVAELKRRGVEFAEVDVPGLKTVGGIADVEGNYPSKRSRGERAAWFR